MQHEETPISQTLLPCGVRLVFAPNKLQIGFAGIYICAGARDELPSEYGVAHLVEHMYFKGTKKRNGFQVFNRVENIGGELNAYTTKEETVIHASFVPLYLGRVLELLSDILCHANFPEQELERERDVVLEEINSYKDEPCELIFDDFEDLLFAGSELGHNILGTTASVRKFRRKHLLAYLQRTYGLDRIALFVTGPYELKKVIALANKYFTEIPYQTSQQNRKLFAPSPLLAEKKIAKRTSQAHCMIGALAPSVRDKRNIAFRLLTEILGGSATTSRLNKRMREKLGLVYTVEAANTTFLDTGYLSVYFATSRDELTHCIEIVKDEIEKMRTKPISASILSKAKTRCIGQFWLANENIESVILTYVRYLLDDILYTPTTQLLAEWHNIEAKDLLALANEYLRPEQLVTLLYV